MIKVENATKYYGSNIGIESVSFEARENEIIGLLGRNGAGKTTTLNIITGYISSDEGSVVIDGYDVLQNPSEAKSKIGYLPEKPPIYMDMTVNEYLDFCADLKGIDKELKKKHIDEICSLTGINEVRKRLCKNLSKGYKQRVGLGQALIGNPEILILDEPAIGLDPNQIIQIRELIKTLGKTHTIIISSHILGEIAEICDRIIIIDQGKIAASDTLENLTNSAKEKKVIAVRIKGADEDFAAELKKIKHVMDVEVIGTHKKDCVDFKIAYKSMDDAEEKLFDYIVASDKKILMMKPKETTLEDVFLQVTANSGEGKK